MTAALALLALLAANPAAPVAAKPPPPDRFGPFVITNAAGDSVGVSFAGQLQLEVNEQLRSGSDTDALIRPRRVRGALYGVLRGGLLRFNLDLDFTPGGLALFDLWGEVALADAAALRAGQFKLPFTRHRWASYRRLVFVDWDLAVDVFGAERQIGAMLHDGLGYGPGFSWAAGVFTGAPTQPRFASGVARAYGERLPNRAALANPGPPADLHPELVLHFAHSADRLDAGTVSDTRGGPLRHNLGFSVTWDARPEETRDFALRLAPELLLKAFGVGFNLVGYAGFVETPDNPLALGILGLTAELAWRFLAIWELAGRYSRADYLEELREAADRGAAAASAEEEVAAGLNAYLVGDSLKWRTDVAWLRTETEGSDREIVRVRSQLQLAF